jgi:hypothetical protein
MMHFRKINFDEATTIHKKVMDRKGLSKTCMKNRLFH